MLLHPQPHKAPQKTEAVPMAAARRMLVPGMNGPDCQSSSLHPACAKPSLRSARLLLKMPASVPTVRLSNQTATVFERRSMDLNANSLSENFQMHHPSVADLKPNLPALLAWRNRTMLRATQPLRAGMGA